MKLTGFGIANYRSFDAQGAFMRDFGKINVFIGRNNSGKSNVLRFVQWLAEWLDDPPGPAEDRLRRHRRGNEPTNESIRLGLSVVLDHEIPVRELRNSRHTDNPRIECWIELPELPGNKPVAVDVPPLPDLSDRALQALHNKLTSSQYMGLPSRKQLLEDATSAVAGKARAELAQMLKGLIYVPAIREVRKGEEGQKKVLDLSGLDLIPRLRSMQHPVVGKEAEQEHFRRAEKWIRELLGVSELVIEIPAEEDAIYLTMYGNRLPLASFGTGVHELVIICTALAIYENRVVCIEEPEIHLHPGLLRRFMRFLDRTSNRYFIATHSNVLLDADVPMSVYHVWHDDDENASRIRKADTSERGRAVLRDLGFKASDLLQTNGIIWVEGPSDRMYINRWLELSGSKFVEGIDYSIMFYGGACLANLTAADSGPTEDFIELLRINQNAIVVIDRDAPMGETPLREYKERIQEEIGEDKCWITQGREIENYLPAGLIERFSKSKSTDQSGEVTFQPDEKIDDCLARAWPDKPLKYRSDKKGYAKELCGIMTAEDLNFLDLKDWIERLHKAIGQWSKG
jgi:predicted ATPase